MEELRKLEQVQETLSFMQSRGFVVSSSNNNDDSNRFLANLILLLVQPSGKLDMAEKCSLIFEYVPKLSASFLEEALPHLSQEGTQINCFGSGIVNENDCGEALVGLDAMQRANSTLEDFCRSYFMFHGMDANHPQAIFKYLPVLSFTESYIYQLDSLNEKIVNMPTDGVTVSERGFEEKAYEKRVSKVIDMLKSDPFRPLVNLLEQHGLLTERIVEEFRCGEEYWALERKLCCALMTKKEISVEDVMKAIHLKSFDYRVLNLILYQLRGEEAKYITESEEKYNRLLKSLDPHLSFNYQRRCEEATKEGGKITGHPLGTWSIPPLIVDEESYRSNLLNMKGTAIPMD